MLNDKYTTFVALLPTIETVEKLNKYCSDNGIKQTVDYNGMPLNGAFEYHITIYYSKGDSKLADGTYEIEPINISPKGIKMLGPNKDIFTIECVKSKELDVLKDFYNLVYGLKSEWADFIPHISLTYDDCDETIIGLPENLVFDKIKVVKKKTVSEEKDYPKMILEKKCVVKENVLLRQFKVGKNVPSIFNRMKPLYTLELPSDINEDFLQEKFDNEKIIIFEYMNKPMRIIDNKITYYLDDQSYVRKLVNEMISEAREVKKKKIEDKKVKNKVNTNPSIDDIPAQ